MTSTQGWVMRSKTVTPVSVPSTAPPGTPRPSTPGQCLPQMTVPSPSLTGLGRRVRVHGSELSASPVFVPCHCCAMLSGCRCQSPEYDPGRSYGVRMSEVFDKKYLPFTEEQLKDHFARVGPDNTTADRHLDYYRKSVQAASDLASAASFGTPAERARAKRHGLQMQKDERFWVVTALMSIFYAPDRLSALVDLLKRCLGDGPPMDGLATWEQALGDPEKLSLFFEVSLPSPPGYQQELIPLLEQRVLVSYVLKSARERVVARRPLEGSTKVDALLIAPDTGFAVLFEAKVLADASSSVWYDVLRNQLARNIDVMLHAQSAPGRATATATSRAVLLRAPHPRDLS
jgi:hypothetical protein